MINKKNFLGSAPVELGTKDAVHVAIVSVRAGAPIKPGQRCSINEFGEAVPGKGPGVANPFVGEIGKGEPFWLLMNPTEVVSVSHTWEHPTVEFGLPTREVVRNTYLVRYADKLGISYEELMKACKRAVEGNPIKYGGPLEEDELDEKIDRYDIFSEWSEETGHEFDNHGSDCCPEYDYPEELFS